MCVVCVSWSFLYVDRSLLSDVACSAFLFVVCVLVVGWVLLCVLIGVVCCLWFHVGGGLLRFVYSLMDVVCWLSMLSCWCLLFVACY